MERFDSIVIGTGPAGLEAAVNLKIRGKNFMLFGPEALSKKINVAPLIENYLGLHGITGAGLANAFMDHIKAMDITITNQKINMVYSMGDYFSLTAGREIYEATTVLLCTGVHPMTEIPGESELLGKGVSYCATCDAMLYKGKRAAVLGYSDESVAEANFLAEIAAEVYFIPFIKSYDKLSHEITVLKGAVKRITGSGRVEAVEMDGQRISVDGAFILRNGIAPTSLVPGIELSDGYIKVDSHMRTSIPGCFAAGDCTGMPHQYIRAAGQGLTAALSAVSYIDDLP